MAPQKKAVIYIKKTGFDYHDGTTGQNFNYNFPPNVVSDLDIVDQEQLEKSISEFIDTNKILPASVLVVFSEPTFFDKTVAEAVTPEQKDTSLRLFLDNVPFENVAYKVFDQQKGFRAVAVNEDMYKDIKEVLEGKGFKLEGLIPEITLGTEGITSAIPKFDALKKESMVSDVVKDTPSPSSSDGTRVMEVEIKKNGSQSKYALPSLMIIVGVLCALGAVIYMQFNPPSVKKSPIPQTIVAPPPTAIPTEIPTSIPSLTAETPTATPTAIQRQIIR